jgi:hypothetical protein
MIFFERTAEKLRIGQSFEGFQSKQSSISGGNDFTVAESDRGTALILRGSQHRTGVFHQSDDLQLLQ